MLKSKFVNDKNFNIANNSQLKGNFSIAEFVYFSITQQERAKFNLYKDFNSQDRREFERFIQQIIVNCTKDKDYIPQNFSKTKILQHCIQSIRKYILEQTDSYLLNLEKLAQIKTFQLNQVERENVISMFLLTAYETNFELALSNYTKSFLREDFLEKILKNHKNNSGDIEQKIFKFFEKIHKDFSFHEDRQLYLSNLDGQKEWLEMIITQLGLEEQMLNENILENAFDKKKILGLWEIQEIQDENLKKVKKNNQEDDSQSEIIVLEEEGLEQRNQIRYQIYLEVNKWLNFFDEKSNKNSDSKENFLVKFLQLDEKDKNALDIFLTVEILQDELKFDDYLKLSNFCYIKEKKQLSNYLVQKLGLESTLKIQKELLMIEKYKHLKFQDDLNIQLKKLLVDCYQQFVSDDVNANLANDDVITSLVKDIENNFGSIQSIDEKRFNKNLESFKNTLEDKDFNLQMSETLFDEYNQNRQFKFEDLDRIKKQKKLPQEFKQNVFLQISFRKILSEEFQTTKNMDLLQKSLFKLKSQYLQELQIEEIKAILNDPEKLKKNHIYQFHKQSKNFLDICKSYYNTLNEMSQQHQNKEQILKNQLQLYQQQIEQELWLQEQLFGNNLKLGYGILEYILNQLKKQSEDFIWDCQNQMELQKISDPENYLIILIQNRNKLQEFNNQFKEQLQLQVNYQYVYLLLKKFLKAKNQLYEQVILVNVSKEIYESGFNNPPQIGKLILTHDQQSNSQDQYLENSLKLEKLLKVGYTAEKLQNFNIQEYCDSEQPHEQESLIYFIEHAVRTKIQKKIIDVNQNSRTQKMKLSKYQKIMGQLYSLSQAQNFKDYKQKAQDGKQQSHIYLTECYQLAINFLSKGFYDIINHPKDSFQRFIQNQLEQISCISDKFPPELRKIIQIIKFSIQQNDSEMTLENKLLFYMIINFSGILKIDVIKKLHESLIQHHHSIILLDIQQNRRKKCDLLNDDFENYAIGKVLITLNNIKCIEEYFKKIKQKINSNQYQQSDDQIFKIENDKLVLFELERDQFLYSAPIFQQQKLKMKQSQMLDVKNNIFNLIQQANNLVQNKQSEFTDIQNKIKQLISNETGVEEQNFQNSPKNIKQLIQQINDNGRDMNQFLKQLMIIAQLIIRKHNIQKIMEEFEIEFNQSYNFLISNLLQFGKSTLSQRIILDLNLSNSIPIFYQQDNELKFNDDILWILKPNFNILFSYPIENQTKGKSTFLNQAFESHFRVNRNGDRKESKNLTEIDFEGFSHCKKQGDRDLFLIDFHGEPLQFNNKKNNVKESLITLSQIILIHINSIILDVCKENVQQEINNIFEISKKKKIIILVRDCPDYQPPQKYEQFDEIQVIKIGIPKIDATKENTYISFRTTITEWIGSFILNMNIDGINGDFQQALQLIQQNKNKSNISRQILKIKDELDVVLSQIQQMNSFSQMYPCYSTYSDTYKKNKNNLQYQEQIIQMINKDQEPSSLIDLFQKYILFESNQEDLEKKYFYFQRKLAQFENINIDQIWRELNIRYKVMNKLLQKNQDKLKFSIQQQQNLAKMGFSFELMDGNLFNIHYEFLQKILNCVGYNAKIYVISILGIQNSGKSTLLNTLFGSEFTVKDGRCTKGANWKLYQVNKQYLSNIDYFLIIDTEGLLSIEANDHQYDRKLTLFTLAVSHLVLYNNNEELDASIRDFLGIAINNLKEFQESTISTPALFLIINQLSDVSKDMSNQIDFIQGAAEIKQRKELDQIIQTHQEKLIQNLGKAYSNCQETTFFYQNQQTQEQKNKQWSFFRYNDSFLQQCLFVLFPKIMAWVKEDTERGNYLHLCDWLNNIQYIHQIIDDHDHYSEFQLIKYKTWSNIIFTQIINQLFNLINNEQIENQENIQQQENQFQKPNQFNIVQEQQINLQEQEAQASKDILENISKNNNIKQIKKQLQTRLTENYGLLSKKSKDIINVTFEKVLSDNKLDQFDETDQKQFKNTKIQKIKNDFIQAVKSILIIQKINYQCQMTNALSQLLNGMHTNKFAKLFKFNIHNLFIDQSDSQQQQQSELKNQNKDNNSDMPKEQSKLQELIQNGNLESQHQMIFNRLEEVFVKFFDDMKVSEISNMIYEIYQFLLQQQKSKITFEELSETQNNHSSYYIQKWQNLRDNNRIVYNLKNLELNDLGQTLKQNHLNFFQQFQQQKSIFDEQKLKDLYKDFSFNFHQIFDYKYYCPNCEQCQTQQLNQQNDCICQQPKSFLFDQLERFFNFKFNDSYKKQIIDNKNDFEFDIKELQVVKINQQFQLKKQIIQQMGQYKQKEQNIIQNQESLILQKFIDIIKSHYICAQDLVVCEQLFDVLKKNIKEQLKYRDDQIQFQLIIPVSIFNIANSTNQIIDQLQKSACVFDKGISILAQDIIHHFVILETCQQIKQEKQKIRSFYASDFIDPGSQNYENLKQNFNLWIQIQENNLNYSNLQADDAENCFLELFEFNIKNNFKQLIKNDIQIELQKSKNEFKQALTDQCEFSQMLQSILSSQQLQNINKDQEEQKQQENIKVILGDIEFPFKSQIIKKLSELFEGTLQNLLEIIQKNIISKKVNAIKTSLKDYFNQIFESFNNFTNSFKKSPQKQITNCIQISYNNNYQYKKDNQYQKEYNNVQKSLIHKILTKNWFMQNNSFQYIPNLELNKFLQQLPAPNKEIQELLKNAIEMTVNEKDKEKNVFHLENEQQFSDKGVRNILQQLKEIIQNYNIQEDLKMDFNQIQTELQEIMIQQCQTFCMEKCQFCGAICLNQEEDHQNHYTVHRHLSWRKYYIEYEQFKAPVLLSCNQLKEDYIFKCQNEKWSTIKAKLKWDFKKQLNNNQQQEIIETCYLKLYNNILGKFFYPENQNFKYLFGDDQLTLQQNNIFDKDIIILQDQQSQHFDAQENKNELIKILQDKINKIYQNLYNKISNINQETEYAQ